MIEKKNFSKYFFNLILIISDTYRLTKGPKNVLYYKGD